MPFTGLVLGRGLAFETGDFALDFTLLLCRETADVDNVRGFERPNKCLNPGYHREKSGPAHDIHGFRVRMLAGDSDPSRQSGQEYQCANRPHPDDEQGNEGDVVPKAKLKAE